MPRKKPLTPKQERRILIRRYRKGYKKLDIHSQSTLQSIEKNKYADKKFHDPLGEAALTYLEWENAGII